MSYFNTDWLTDMHVRDIADREDISVQIARLDSEIETACLQKNVLPEDIPVDNDGYLTSGTLISFAVYSLYVTILSDYWGGAMGDNNDIYFSKLEYFTRERNNSKAMLTTDNILGVPLTGAAYIQQVPVY